MSEVSERTQMTRLNLYFLLSSLMMSSIMGFETLTEEKQFVEIMAENPGLSKSWISKLHSNALKKLKVAYDELETGA